MLPTATLLQSQLYGIVNAIRLQESIYKTAGSVHGCALFRGDEMLVFRRRRRSPQRHRHHRRLDVDAGRVCGMAGADKVFYTTGRLTSEMVIKAAQMGVPIVVSRSGITEMGLEVAQRVGLCAIGRATHKRFLCYSAFERLELQPELAGARLRAVA